MPPDIQLEKTSSDTTVNEGEDATLVCHATGRPLPTIIWRREDGKAFHVKNTKRTGKCIGGLMKTQLDTLRPLKAYTI